MSSGLFAYPKKAEVGKVVHKNKIYANAKLSTVAKKKFVDQVEKIVWQYKLSPESINLPAKENVLEIEIFSITLRVPDICEDVLRIIDNAIPLPVIYEIVFDGLIKTKAAFKRPSVADRSKWVTDIYFESGWQSENADRSALPVALDLGLLYEQLLRSLMPVKAKKDEDIRGQVERLTQLRSVQAQLAKLQARMNREKQFNRKVQLNAELRKLKRNIQELIKENTENTESPE